MFLQLAPETQTFDPGWCRASLAENWLLGWASFATSGRASCPSQLLRIYERSTEWSFPLDPYLQVHTSTHCRTVRSFGSGPVERLGSPTSFPGSKSEGLRRF